MRYVSSLAALTAMLIAIPASAEPYGFKGTVIGSPLSQIASNRMVECMPASAPTADRICFLGKGESETIAGTPVDSIFYFYFQNRLTGITINFEEKAFETVVKALQGKYGIPTRHSDAVKTLAGKSYENVTYHWQQPGQSIDAERYTARIDKSSIRISEDGAEKRIRQIREHLVKQPGSDL